MFGGLMEKDDPTKLPIGVSALARGIKFHGTSAQTRDGIRADFGVNTGTSKSITGLSLATLSGNPEVNKLFVYDSEGKLRLENPAGSGAISGTINDAFGFIPAGSSMQAANAFQRLFIALTDLVHPANFNGPINGQLYNLKNDWLDPLSMKPVGVTWTPDTSFFVGEVVTPTVVGGNGHTYRCTVAGRSGLVEPGWPLTVGGTVVDGGFCTWQENTMRMLSFMPVPPNPLVSVSGGGGTFAAGRDVWIALTWVNAAGLETSISTMAVSVNTNLNDAIVVAFPIEPPELVAVTTGDFHIVSYRVYEVDFATGHPAPAASDFKLWSTSSLGVATTVTHAAVGAAPPLVTQIGTNFVSTGNVSNGQRYAVVLFVDRNDYITGMSDASVIGENIPFNNFALSFDTIPLGPSPQTAARIIAITPAGQLNQIAGTGVTAAGPYFWIPPRFPIGTFDLAKIPAGVTVNSVVNGVSMTSTLINDNTTTAANFNFTDDFLKSTQNDVSSYFRKIQVPPLADVQYLPSIQRMAYATDNLPQGWYISALNDPETIFGDTGLVDIEDTNGTRTAIRELRGTVYPMKMRAGYTLTPNPSDPSRWTVTLAWTGVGPCGFRAVDVCKEFMVFVHRSGVYIYFGSDLPRLISDDIPKTWATINWAAQQTIWVMIDEETRTVRVGVPTVDSLVPNLVLTCNYEESPTFDPPTHVTMSGELKATIKSRKWSTDPIAANVCVRAERILANATEDMDQSSKRSQILYGSSNPDGQVSPIIVGTRSDYGVNGTIGIECDIETVCHEDMLPVTRMGGIKADINGGGDTWFTLLFGRGRAAAEGGTDPALRYLEVPLKKAFNPQTEPGRPGYSCGARGTNERVRARVSNNKIPEAWFDLKHIILYGNQVSGAEPK